MLLKTYDEAGTKTVESLIYCSRKQIRPIENTAFHLEVCNHLYKRPLAEYIWCWTYIRRFKLTYSQVLRRFPTAKVK